MAVDIDVFVERSEAGRWRFAGRMIPNPELEYCPDDPDEPALVPEPMVRSYHKELACILTDTGFRMRTAVPFVPIVPRRNLPADASAELTDWFARIIAQERSEHWLFINWFTAREVLEFDWRHRIILRCAMVDPQAAPLFADRPRGWPGKQWPAGIPQSMSMWRDGGIEVEWFETYAEIVPEFIKEVFPTLQAAANPDALRLLVSSSW